MGEWIYFIHPPREDFAATMTAEEDAVWGLHFARFERMLAEGSLILVGPTLGTTNTGIAIFDAPDEAAVGPEGQLDESVGRRHGHGQAAEPIGTEAARLAGHPGGIQRRAAGDQ